MNYVGFNAICIFLNVISVKKETNRLSPSVPCSGRERRCSVVSSTFHRGMEQRAEVLLVWWRLRGARVPPGRSPEVADSLPNYTHVACKRDALHHEVSLAPCSQLLCELESRGLGLPGSLFPCRQSHLNLRLSCLERRQLNTGLSPQCH